MTPSIPDKAAARIAGAAITVLAFSVGMVLVAAGAATAPVVVVAAPIAVIGAITSITRPDLAIVAVVLSIPFGHFVLPGGLELIETVALAAVALVIAARLARGLVPLHWPPAAWWAAALVAVAALSTARSVDPALAFKHLGHVVIGFLLMLAIPAAIRTLEQVERVVVMLVVVGAGYALYIAVTASRLEAIGDSIVAGRATGGFASPNELGTFAAIGIVLALGLAGHRATQAPLLSAVSAAMLLVALVLSLSRGAWLGAALGVVVFAALTGSVALRVLFVVVPVVVVAGLAGPMSSDRTQVEVVEERLATLTNPEANAYDARPAIYSEAVRQIRNRPLTGFGPGTFSVVSQRQESSTRTIGAVHAHNTLLTTAAEAGLPAAAALVGLTVTIAAAVWRRVRRSARRSDASLVAGLAGALAVLIGQGLVDFTLRNPVVMAVAWLVLGLTIAAVTAVDDRSTKGRAQIGGRRGARYRVAAATQRG